MKNSEYPSIRKPQNEGYKFTEIHPVIPPLSIYNAINILNMKNKNNKAINCLDLTVTYEQMLNDAVLFSNAFKELGVKKGDIVSIKMENYYQAFTSFLACNRLGAVTTFLNSSADNKEICDYLNEFESPLLINYNENEYENRKIYSNTHVKNIITLKEHNLMNTNYKEKKLDNDTFIDFNSLGHLSNGKKQYFPVNHSNDNALILFTSGTTGKPKSVMISNKNVLAAATYLNNSSHSTELNGNNSLVCVPFSYPYGLVTSCIMTVMTGRQAILAPYFSKDTIEYYIRKNPNIIFGSPAVIELMLRKFKTNEDLRSIRHFISGGDYLTPKLRNIFSDFLSKHGANNVEIGNGAGNAETVSCGLNPTGVKVKPETVGKVLTGTVAYILNPEDTSKECKFNEIGELYISGEHIFKGYYKDENSTEEVIKYIDGHKLFKTGMIGSLDEEGYFHLTGRKSRFYIISSLQKVYCDKVQTMITYLDNICECAVVKVPDENELFAGKAYIVLNEGIEETEDLKEYILNLLHKPINVNGEELILKPFEIPKYIEFVKELPRRQGTDKINYRLLEQDALKELEKNNTKILK